MLDEKQMKDNNRKSTAKFKLRRRTLYTNKATKQARKELQEAPSYGSNIVLNLDPTAQLQKGPELTVLNKINFDECKAILKDCEALLQDPITRPQVKSQLFLSGVFILQLFDMGYRNNDHWQIS